MIASIAALGVGVRGEQHPPRAREEVHRLLEELDAVHLRHPVVGEQHRHLVAAQLHLAQRVQRLLRRTRRARSGTARRTGGAGRGRPPGTRPGRRRRSGSPFGCVSACSVITPIVGRSFCGAEEGAGPAVQDQAMDAERPWFPPSRQLGPSQVRRLLRAQPVSAEGERLRPGDAGPGQDPRPDRDQPVRARLDLVARGVQGHAHEIAEVAAARRAAFRAPARRPAVIPAPGRCAGRSCRGRCGF